MGLEPEKWMADAREGRRVFGMMIDGVVVDPPNVEKALAQLDARQAVRDLHHETWIDELRAGA